MGYGLWAAIDVYTPEAYPTSVRGVGNSAAGSMARLAGIVGPFIDVSLTFISTSQWITLGVWGGMFGVVGVLALMLPIETKGRVLDDTIASANLAHARRQSQQCPSLLTPLTRSRQTSSVALSESSAVGRSREPSVVSPSVGRSREASIIAPSQLV